MFSRKSYLQHESPVKKILLKFFSKTEQINILDIGACEGEESIKYKEMYPEATIFLFEPLPKNQALIIENIEINKLKNVNLVPVALSDSNGHTKFYTSSGQPNNTDLNLDWDFGNKSSSLLPPQLNNLPDWLKFEDETEVQTMMLDSFLKKNKIDTVDFIHMDVQGAELNVLKGAKDSIKHIKTLWLEVSDIELYKNQPLRFEIELFMKKNNFQLIKSEMTGDFGDQFYVNKKFFKTYNFFNGLLQFHFKLN